MRVLVTGFEPYGKNVRNPTQALAQYADGRTVSGCALAGRVLPTTFDGSVRELRRHIADIRPRYLLMFGLAPARTTLSLEVLALNVRHADEPDNEGRRPWREPIRPRAPRTLETRMPIDAIYRALKRARLPVSVSYHAGTYVCNHAYYEALRFARRASVGFIHVPPKLGPGRLRAALRVILRALVRTEP